MSYLPAKRDNTVSATVTNLGPDEYLNADDQLIYCSKCNTPKQMWLKPNGFFKEPRAVPIFCAYRKKEREEALREKLQKEKAARIPPLYQAVSFPACLIHCTFDLSEPYHTEILSFAKDYVERLLNEPDFSDGLLFYGPPEKGKTYITACIANYLI